MFLALPENDRLKIAEELSRSIPQLSGSSMGRSVMDTCAARHYSRGLEEWRHAMKRSLETIDDWEKEVFGNNGSNGGSSKKRRKNSDQQ